MANSTFTWTQAASIILFILAVYMILTRLFGHSVTDLAITAGLFTLLFINQYHLNREMGEMKTSMKFSFTHVKDDIGTIKNDLISIKKKLKV